MPTIAVQWLVRRPAVPGTRGPGHGLSETFGRQQASRVSWRCHCCRAGGSGPPDTNSRHGPDRRSPGAMSLTAAAATFVAVLPAELPDKTILACLILSRRYRPSVVFSGAATAFLAQVILAVAAGGALSLLPHHIVEACAAAAFLAGAVLLWRQKEDKDEEEEDTGR